jgi:uncharacterized membrane protein (UPF0182 family)
VNPSTLAGRSLPPAISFQLRWGIFALLVIGVVLSVVLGLVQKWLWMRQLDYAGNFWTLLSVKWGIFGLSLFISMFYLWINLRFAARNIDVLRGASFFSKEFTHPADAKRTINIDISPRLLIFAIDAGIVILSLLFALECFGAVGHVSPLSLRGGRSESPTLFLVSTLGFMCFRLPFYELLQGSITVLTVAALAILAFCAVFGVRQSKPSRMRSPLPEGTARHFNVLLSILAANFTWGFILDHYELVYSTLGVVHGAGYAAAHVTSVAFWVMTGASALACVLLAFGFFRPRAKLVVAGIVAYLALYVVAVMALPYLFQTFVVKPNELRQCK